MSRFSRFLSFLLVSFIILYTAFWFIGAKSLQKFLEDAISQSGPHVKVSYSKIKVTGFPFKF
jgi:hypothetical protein